MPQVIGDNTYVVNATIQHVVISPLVGHFEDKSLAFAFASQNELMTESGNMIVWFFDSAQLTCPTHACVLLHLSLATTSRDYSSRATSTNPNLRLGFPVVCLCRASEHDNIPVVSHPAERPTTPPHPGRFLVWQTWSHPQLPRIECHLGR
ncbi:hypothetical protein DSO57_1005023 [Entomophthora muscae]|uniref:Uncharacterized protein n=1 Tax=Entomophthora muscae TaxID=34485 RepID=A0ACC2TJ16_9FUNG|nr:hypothetical protein DSO57_1005023 [Entomophthora muscae]